MYVEVVWQLHLTTLFTFTIRLSHDEVIKFRYEFLIVYVIFKAEQYLKIDCWLMSK